MNVGDWIRHKQLVARNLVHHYGRGRRFRRFERSVHPATWARHEELLRWAESRASANDVNEAEGLYAESPDPIVRQGFTLRREILHRFANRCGDQPQLRVLIHTPPPEASSAYASLCENFLQGLCFLGVAARGLGWVESTREVLEGFQPTVLMSVDHEGYLSRIDWSAVATYRATHPLRLALNASLEEYGNSPLPPRLEWARRNAVDFYYSFKAREYVDDRYRVILDRGYAVLSLEFGANPLLYYPVPEIERDLPYVFLGSTNPDKWPRYRAYFGPLLATYPGYIDGPWWSAVSRFGRSETHRYICARARVALNLHIQNQLEWAGELNERLYNLAACGVPQLVDAPKLLDQRFSPDSFFVGRTPEEYHFLFIRILNDREEAERRALQAQREVFARHTIFHRLEQFLVALRRVEPVASA